MIHALQKFATLKVSGEINIRDDPYIMSAYFWTFSDPPTQYVSTESQQ